MFFEKIPLKKIICFFLISFYTFIYFFWYITNKVNIFNIDDLNSSLKEDINKFLYFFDEGNKINDQFYTYLDWYIRFLENPFFPYLNYDIFLSEKLIDFSFENTFRSIFIFHYVVSSLFLIIGILIAVAFFTLLERKVMASMQRRKGPNVVGFWGLLQPLADGLKLLAKEIIIPKKASIRIFLGSPLYTFLISLLGWCVIPLSNNIVFTDIKLSALYVFAVSSLGVYGVFFAGWSSNSKYAFLGGLRSTAQMISYEIALGFILLIVGLFSGTYNLREMVYKQESVWYCFPLFPLVLIFFVSMLAETNRAPFDLPEAEAELVSGYNTEYSSIIFAMFFLGEYSSMLLMAALMVIFFFGGWLPPFLINFEVFSGFWFFFKIVIIAFSYVWVRATLPRYRYNQLMSIGWKIFLPLTFGLLVFYVGLLLFLDGLPCKSVFNNPIIEVSLNINDNKDMFLLFKDLIVYFKV